jgi:hypothetical protein
VLDRLGERDAAPILNLPYTGVDPSSESVQEVAVLHRREGVGEFLRRREQGKPLQPPQRHLVEVGLRDIPVCDHPEGVAGHVRLDVADGFAGGEVRSMCGVCGMGVRSVRCSAVSSQKLRTSASLSPEPLSTTPLPRSMSGARHPT